MSALVVHGSGPARVVAEVELLDGPAGRLRGVIGRTELSGAVLLRPACSVHTLGVRIPLDVAYCTGGLVVLDTVRMAPGRLSAPRWASRAVLEAAAGRFAEWGIRAGVHLELV